MNIIEIYSLPQITFAHTYSCEKYLNSFKKSHNIIEIFYIADGKLLIESENQRVFAKQNDVVCFLHNNAVKISSPRFHTHHTVAAKVEWELMENISNGLYLPIVTPQVLDTAHIRKLIDDFIYGRNSYEESISKNACQFLRILTEIDRCNRNAISSPFHGDVLYAERAKKYIHKHLSMPITQAEVANHLGISPGYLCSVFKKVQGVPLMQYINKVKLEAISQIMEREHLKLYEAATLFGYTDANYVSRLYKKMFQHNISDKPKKA